MRIKRPHGVPFLLMDQVDKYLQISDAAQHVVPRHQLTNKDLTFFQAWQHGADKGLHHLAM
jgi:hypothetical protein